MFSFITVYAAYGKRLQWNYLEAHGDVYTHALFTLCDLTDFVAHLVSEDRVRYVEMNY